MVSVTAGSRIHINSIDMNGERGLCGGGFGVYLESPSTKIDVQRSVEMVVESLYPEKVLSTVKKLKQKLNVGGNYSIKITDEIKEHIGLGSETQLNLAIAKAVYFIEDIPFSTEEVCSILGLGGVSGVGVYCFNFGGFVVETGYSLGCEKKSFIDHSTKLPHLLFHCDFPEEWKLLIIYPKNSRSLSGEEETVFFKKNTPVTKSEVDEISFNLLMKLIPAVQKKDFVSFINAMKVVTQYGTKKSEIELNSNNCSDILEYMNTVHGFGAVSSLGPVCYTFINDEKSLDLLQLNKRFNNHEIILTKVINGGAYETL